MGNSYMGWGGLKNGELLKAAEDAGIDVFVTGDQALQYQQNIASQACVREPREPPLFV